MDTTRRHALRLRRGRRLWDRMARPEGERQAAWADALSTLAREHLDLRAGEAVLDIGCGAGAAFETLHAAVGPTGQVVGIDYSPGGLFTTPQSTRVVAVQHRCCKINFRLVNNPPGMLARAQRRIARHGWENVAIRRADFTRTEREAGRFDAAAAVFSLSAMPDVPAALATAHAALRPGGRLFVIDMRLVPAGWSTPLIWLSQGLYRGLAGWSGVDVLDTARGIFPVVTLPDPPGRPGGGQPTAGWPPLTMFVATKAALRTHPVPAQP
jgi:ubiquinone/menaquinone biosynthesis C-methylase UbiE